MDTEQDVVRRLRSGSPGEVGVALWEVYLEYGDLLLGIARKFAGDEAEDLVNDLISYLPGKVQTFVYRGKGSFKAWLATCVANAAKDVLRKRQKEIPASQLITPAGDDQGQAGEADQEARLWGEPDWSPDVDDGLTSQRLKREVRKMLSDLKEEDVDVIVGIDLIGLSARQYGDRVGVSHDTVRKRHERAKKRLLERALESSVIREWALDMGLISEGKQP